MVNNDIYEYILKEKDELYIQINSNKEYIKKLNIENTQINKKIHELSVNIDDTYDIFSPNAPSEEHTVKEISSLEKRKNKNEDTILLLQNKIDKIKIRLNKIVLLQNEILKFDKLEEDNNNKLSIQNSQYKLYMDICEENDTITYNKCNELYELFNNHFLAKYENIEKLLKYDANRARIEFSSLKKDIDKMIVNIEQTMFHVKHYNVNKNMDYLILSINNNLPPKLPDKIFGDMKNKKVTINSCLHTNANNPYNPNNPDITSNNSNNNYTSINNNNTIDITNTNYTTSSDSNIEFCNDKNKIDNVQENKNYHSTGKIEINAKLSDNYENYTEKSIEDNVKKDTEINGVSNNSMLVNNNTDEIKNVNIHDNSIDNSKTENTIINTLNYINEENNNIITDHGDKHFNNNMTSDILMRQSDIIANIKILYNFIYLISQMNFWTLINININIESLSVKSDSCKDVSEISLDINLKKQDKKIVRINISTDGYEPLIINNQIILSGKNKINKIIDNVNMNKNTNTFESSDVNENIDKKNKNVLSNKECINNKEEIGYISKQKTGKKYYDNYHVINMLIEYLNAKLIINQSQEYGTNISLEYDYEL